MVAIASTYIEGKIAVDDLKPATQKLVMAKKKEHACAAPPPHAHPKM